MKKTRQQAELEKAQVWMIIHSKKNLASFIATTHDSYARLYNSVDFMVKSHNIPSVGSLTKAKRRNQVRQEIEEYLDQFRQISTKEDHKGNFQV